MSALLRITDSTRKPSYFRKVPKGDIEGHQALPR
jgi:hypothetical protein